MVSISLQADGGYKELVSIFGLHMRELSTAKDSQVLARDCLERQWSSWQWKFFRKNSENQDVGVIHSALGLKMASFTLS